MTENTTNDLTGEFVKIIVEWLEPSELEELRSRTPTAPANVCLSHDYCDANQAMLDAGERVGVDVLNDTSTANAAWDMAKARNWEPPATLTDVTAELIRLGYNAGMYNTGGHVMCIAVAKVGESLDKYRLFIGNECGWGADIYDGDGEHTGSVNLEEIKPLDSALQIAETLVQAIIAQTVGEPC